MAIVTIPGAVARAPNGWTVSPEPDLVIGREGAADYQFDAIAGLMELPGGNILVIDQGSAEIRLYDESGTFLRRLGRAGDGPGEFRRPTLVPGVTADSLVVFDSRLNRFTRMSLDLGGVQTQSPGTRVIGLPLGVSGGRVFLRSPNLVIRGGLGPRPVVPATFSFVDPATGAADTVAALDGPQITPPSLDVQQIGLDYVLGVHTDDLRVQTIHRHRLIRSP